MTTSTKSLYAGHRFPPELISYTVWLYYRFPLGVCLCAPGEAGAIQPVEVRSGKGVAPPGSECCGIIGDDGQRVARRRKRQGSPHSPLMIRRRGVNQRRRHLFARRHARRSLVRGRERICPWVEASAWPDQAATAP